MHGVSVNADWIFFWYLGVYNLIDIQVCIKFPLCVLQAAILEAAHQCGFRAEGGEGAEDLL